MFIFHPKQPFLRHCYALENAFESLSYVPTDLNFSSICFQCMSPKMLVQRTFDFRYCAEKCKFSQPPKIYWKHNNYKIPPNVHSGDIV